MIKKVGTIRVDKRAIRNLPCGRCGGVPPFADGSRCHPHRLVPGCEGGEYTEGNVVPRCPSCHDIEHGGDGTAPFIGAAKIGGAIGGKIGGRRVHEVYPEMARANGIKYGPAGGRRRQELYPGLSQENGRKYGAKGGHRVHELHPNLAHEWAQRVQELYPGQGAENLRLYREQHPEACREAGRKGGLISRGGPSPEQASRAGQRMHELHPGKASATMLRLQTRSPGMAREAGLKSGHVRWHLGRGVTNQACKYCSGAAQHVIVDRIER